MLDLLKQDAQVGDSLNLFLTSGNTVNGVIVEIGENYLLMEVDGVKRRYFPQLIGGWDVVRDSHQRETSQSHNEQPAYYDDAEKDKEDSHEDDNNEILISLFDSIYENEQIVTSASIKTNAVVEKVTPTGVSVITDGGETMICHKGFMVGFSRSNCTPGKRLFCGSVNTNGSQKGICFLSVLQMSFEEMRERYIQALSAKSGPRKPIINSIIAYFRKNNNGKSTKKIIADLRNRVSLLGTSSKVGNSQLDKFISLKQYEKAFDYIEKLVCASEDDKQKSALLLRKAQLYSSLKDYQNAISAYRDLITFNEHINSPSKNLSHLYTELSRLLFLTEDNEQAEGARNIALMLNPQNSIAKKIGGLVANKGNNNGETTETFVSNYTEKEQSSQIVKFTGKSLIDDDIDRYTFTDSEIVSLNGGVSIDIANRLLESASTSEDYIPHIEAAKALKSLPIGSYDIQDLEDSIANYSINRCQALFNSYKKVIFESDSLESISIEQLKKIKDTAICYYTEAIEMVINDDSEAAIRMLTNCLLLELTSLLIKEKKSREDLLEALDFSTEDFVKHSTSPELCHMLPVLFVKLALISVQCSNLWDTLVLKSSDYKYLLSFVNDNISIKEEIIKLTPKRKGREVNDIDFINNLRTKISNKLSGCYNQLKTIGTNNLDIASIRPLFKRYKTLSSKSQIWCFCDTDQKSIVSINHFVSILVLYQKKNKDERKKIILSVLFHLLFTFASKWDYCIR